MSDESKTTPPAEPEAAKAVADSEKAAAAAVASGSEAAADDAGGSATATAGAAVWAPAALAPVVRLSGEVVHGFGRGSKMLGIPTANLPPEALGDKLGSTQNGVYFGWAQVDKGPVYKTVLSIGWNPHFKNTERTVEPYLLHKFDDDFYGAQLSLLICGFLREQAAFSSLDELITAIHKDVDMARELLDTETYVALQRDGLFTGTATESAETEATPTA